ncbi:MAG: hypothetical protein M0Q91_06440 [Methanoregula sp.]|jgi:hypothetical protein|nr:hypothetical protein [Methanoregula sp.]
MKKILIAGIMVLIVGVIITAFFFLSAMTDPIPPEVRTGWYLPHQDIVWTNSGPDLIPSTQERLILAGHRDAPAPQFPALSPYSRYENYTHLATNDQYMIAVWYFNDERKFLESQKNLVGFLETNGKLSSVELNFTEHSIRNGKSGPGLQDSQKRSTIPDYIKASGYESVDTSGYFFTVAIPGPEVPAGNSYSAINNEYYIVYYGTTTPANLTSQIQFLKDMIAGTYRYDHLASVDALVRGAE